MGLGDTQGGKIRPVSREVSVHRCGTQLQGRGTKSDFPPHMGTAAGLFLFTEHTPCPQSHLMTPPALPISIIETQGNSSYCIPWVSQAAPCSPFPVSLCNTAS